MAVDVWNKVNIPRPSVVSTCRIDFRAETDRITERVVSHCEDALKLLRSKVLRTEIRLLYEILYVVNNSQRQHKPFRAVKQVEQCINRLNEMKLQGALQDLQELCPNKIQRDVGVEVGQCSVPCQPMLEWFCLKLLGASSLLARTLDQCIKAFSLTRQHLRLAEFIVLNLVILSIISRLWVFFRGILRALLPVYKSTIELRQQVAQCVPMAYLTDYNLPQDLEGFLSTSHCDLLKVESTTLAPKTSALNKLFQGGTEEQVEDVEEEESQMMQMLATEGLGQSSMDLGTTILREGPYYPGSSSEFDIKSMLLRTHGISKECVAEVFKKASPVESNISDLALVQQKRAFLKQLRTASSFTEVAVQLKEMMNWCRRCKLHQERRHLSFLLLQCRRMKSLDGEGVRVQKKLRRLCLRVKYVMVKGTEASQPQSSPAFLWRTQCCIQNRFRTLMTRYGSVRNRLTVSRTPSHIAKDLFGVIAKKKGWKNVKVLPKEDFVKQRKLESEVMHSQKENSVVIEDALEKPSNVKKSEIDDIFAMIGF